MGARGPKTLPTKIHILRGNASKKPLGELRDGAMPLVEIPDCPKYLLPVAKKYWKHVTPLLYAEGLVAEMDRAALESLCQTYAWYVWHDTCLQRAVAIAAEKRSAWEADPANAGREWAGGDGLTTPTSTGYPVLNSHFSARRQMLSDLDRQLANFGLSPSARSRVTPSSEYPFLPGMEPGNDAPAQPTAKITSLKDFAAKGV